MDLYIGIHFGISQITVSSYSSRSNKTELLLQYPAYCTFTDIGEILTGKRCEQFLKCHPDKEKFSILDLLHNYGNENKAQFHYRGMNYSLDNIVKNQIDPLISFLHSKGNVSVCVLSISIRSFHCRQMLLNVFRSQGLILHRIILPATACAYENCVTHSHGSIPRQNFWIFENNRLSSTGIDYGVSGILEVTHNTEMKFENHQLANYELLFSQCLSKEYQTLRSFNWKEAIIKNALDGLSGSPVYYADESIKQNLNHLKPLFVMNLPASSGAAYYAAYLGGWGKYNPHLDILVLDAITMFYEAEFVDRSGQILIRRHEIFNRNETFPSTNAYDYFKKGRSISNGIILNLYERSDLDGTAKKICQLDLGSILGEPQVNYGWAFTYYYDLTKNNISNFFSILAKNHHTGRSERIILNTDLSLTQQQELLPDKAMQEIQRIFLYYKNETDRLTGTLINSPNGQGVIQISKLMNVFVTQWSSVSSKGIGLTSQSSQMRDMITKLLEITDSMQYAILSVRQKSEEYQYLFLLQTYTWLLQSMERFLMITAVDAEGVTFDPYKHEAVGLDTVNYCESDMILAEVQKGYYFNNRLFRASKVRVADNPGLTGTHTSDSKVSDYQSHYMRQYSGKGICQSLYGKTYLTFVYVNDPESNWSVSEKEHQNQMNTEVVTYLISEAKKESVPLKIFVRTYEITVNFNVNHKNRTDLNDVLAKALGYPSLIELNMAMLKENPEAQHCFIFLLNKSGRSIAHIAKSEDKSVVEQCMVFKTDFSDLLHEVLHIFGAKDLYFPPETKQAAEDILKESVMLDGSSKVMDDVTKYLIGWHKTPTITARQMLDRTADTTDTFYERARKYEAQTRNGSGLYRYPNGDIYEGDFQNGIPDGYGKIIRPDGSVLHGYFKNGSYMGERKI